MEEKNDKIPTPYELFHVECGDGWAKLLQPIFDYIENYNKDKEKAEDKIEIFQVKEKFGTLRFYTSFYTDDLRNLIREAEHESAYTCEFCGSKEHIGYTLGWITVCCKECVTKMAQGKSQPIRWKPYGIGDQYKWAEVDADGNIEYIKKNTV